MPPLAQTDKLLLHRAVQNHVGPEVLAALLLARPDELSSLLLAHPDAASKAGMVRCESDMRRYVCCMQSCIDVGSV